MSADKQNAPKQGAMCRRLHGYRGVGLCGQNIQNFAEEVASQLGYFAFLPKLTCNRETLCTGP